MGFVQEFKEFALKGNVVDMAVGIIIGAAFGKIVSSAVADLIMPPIGLAMGGVDFGDLKMVLQEGMSEEAVAAAVAEDPEAKVAAAAEVAIRYGKFINVMIDFLIVALAIFVAIKVMNSFQKEEEPEPDAPAEIPKEEALLTEIRDLLAKQNS